ncbi:hypothetical protein AV530_006102 [Patagioenas fasciata monilis]|uniref:Uncharacterized protein n=1 Tax=Patagioenas fasciata monilis TaxID=372326 RepID=A0A1V4J9J7_PATFA|nr:hypothetical protein AV530_006102 [Patagioenas fasciata monilis]
MSSKLCAMVKKHISFMTPKNLCENTSDSCSETKHEDTVNCDPVILKYQTDEWQVLAISEKCAVSEYIDTSTAQENKK